VTTVPDIFVAGRWLFFQEQPPSNAVLFATPIDDVTAAPSRVIQATSTNGAPRGVVRHPVVPVLVDEVRLRRGSRPPRVLGIYRGGHGVSIRDLLEASARAGGTLPHAIVATTLRAFLDAASASGDTPVMVQTHTEVIDFEGNVWSHALLAPRGTHDGGEQQFVRVQQHLAQLLGADPQDIIPGAPGRHVPGTSWTWPWIEALARWQEPTLPREELAAVLHKLVPERVERERERREQLGMLDREALLAMAHLLFER
jgi:hypothetical protein